MYDTLFGCMPVGVLANILVLLEVGGKVGRDHIDAGAYEVIATQAASSISAVFETSIRLGVLIAEGEPTAFEIPHDEGSGITIDVDI